MVGAHFDRGPDRVLIGSGAATLRATLACLHCLRASQRRVGSLRRGLKLLRVPGVIPAPCLHAGDRHLEALPGGDQDAGVECPVLLGAEHLLAAVEKYVL